MRQRLPVAIPLPLLMTQNHAASFCVNDWVLWLLIGTAFVLGWFASTLKGHKS